MKPENRKFDPSLNAMQKVGAAIVRDGKVLVVRKNTQKKTDYFMAGGKMEPGETQIETLRRELDEELGVRISEYLYVGSFEDLAVFEGTPIVIHAYYVLVDNEPVSSSEIKEYRWISPNFEQEGIPVSSIMAKQVIPELVSRGLL